ncbi:hypothetical protein GCM10022254_30910 [Actinomadura meridiana]|uniref:Uncharacterized protein n=1 Tax=Actinomadura meridiana TaxID=559626 RepID=A0ABP8C1H6_9ACTN
MAEAIELIRPAANQTAPGSNTVGNPAGSGSRSTSSPGGTKPASAPTHNPALSHLTRTMSDIGQSLYDIGQLTPTYLASLVRNRWFLRSSLDSAPGGAEGAVMRSMSPPLRPGDDPCADARTTAADAPLLHH